MSKSLIKAIKVLDCFTLKPEMTIIELVEMAKMPKTTVFRLATSLEEAGLLVKEKRSSHDVIYRMSLKLLTYSAYLSEQLKYKKIALPHMKRLNEEIDELVHMTIREGNEAVYVETIDSTKMVRLVVKVGARAPLYAGSAPKLLLSSMDDEELRTYLDQVELNKITKNTLTSKERVIEEVKKIKEKGYSISYSENFENTVGFSYPVYDYKGDMVAAIGVSIPDFDHTKEREIFLLSKLEKTVKDICKELGYERVQ